MQIVETLRDENQLAIVFVHHGIAQAARYADNEVALKHGLMYAWGPPEKEITKRLLAGEFDIEGTVIKTAYSPQVVPIESLEDDEYRTSLSQSERDEANPDSPE